MNVKRSCTKIALDIAGFIFGCITIAMMVVTACYAQVPNTKTPYTQQVICFTRETNSVWTNRMIRIHSYPNAEAKVCFQLKPTDKTAQCFWTEGSLSAVEPTEILGEART